MYFILVAEMDDIHICGRCRQEFHNLDDYVAHKRTGGCPVSSVPQQQTIQQQVLQAQQQQQHVVSQQQQQVLQPMAAMQSHTTHAIVGQPSSMNDTMTQQSMNVTQTLSEVTVSQGCNCKYLICRR